VLMLLGQTPSPSRLAEHLPAFLASHSFHDLASLLASRLDCMGYYDEEMLEEEFARGYSAATAKIKPAQAEPGNDAPQAVQQ